MTFELVFKGSNIVTFRAVVRVSFHMSLEIGAGRSFILTEITFIGHFT